MNVVSPPPVAVAPQEVSRPVVVAEYTFYTHSAHRVIDRVQRKALRALYAVHVIVPIITASSKDNQDEQLHEAIRRRITETHTFFDKETAKWKKLKEDRGVAVEEISYSNPRVIQVELTSPLGRAFIDLIKRMDDVVKEIDVLWWAGVFTDRQRLNAAFHLQGHLVKLGQHFIKMESRARAAALRQGIEDKVRSLAGDQTAPLSELAGDGSDPTAAAPVQSITEETVRADLTSDEAGISEPASSSEALVPEEVVHAEESEDKPKPRAKRASQA